VAGFPQPSSSAARRGVRGVRQLRDPRPQPCRGKSWGAFCPAGSASRLGEQGSGQCWLLGRARLVLAACWGGSAHSGGPTENAEAEPPSSPVFGTGAPACAASSPSVSLEHHCRRGCLLSSLCFGLTCSASVASSAEVGDLQGRGRRVLPARRGKARLAPGAGERSWLLCPRVFPLSRAVVSTEQWYKPVPGLRG